MLVPSEISLRKAALFAGPEPYVNDAVRVGLGPTHSVETGRFSGREG